LSRFPPGTGVVLVVVFFTVAGLVMYPVFAMLHLHVCTAVKSALQLLQTESESREKNY
jgi:hypothetical protein